MSLAWSSVALVTFLLPGLLFFVGLTFPEQFTRENARKSPLGQLAGAAFVSLFLHGFAFLLLDHVVAATGWAGAGIRLDYVLAAFQSDQGESAVSPAALAANISDNALLIIVYFGALCCAGWLVGAAAGEQVVRGRLTFLARHAWVYAIRPGVSLAHVLTHKHEGNRHLLYDGILKDFGLKDDGTFSYIVLESVTRRYLTLKEHGPTTDGAGGPPMSVASGMAPFLAIEGEDVANVVIVPGIRRGQMDDAGRLRLRQALEGDEGAVPPRIVRYRWWTSFWAWTALAVSIAGIWVIAVHWFSPAAAAAVAGVIGGLAWMALWVLAPMWRRFRNEGE